MLSGGLPRILSRPVRVHWLGWETTTYDLQQAGWELSAEQDPYRMTMRIAIRHQQAAMEGITNGVDWRYEVEDRYGSRPIEQCLRMRTLTRQIVIHDHGPFDFSPIDATPQLSREEIHSLEDLVHFAGAPLVRSKAIVLTDASVDQLLERALELQEPARQAYYDASVKEHRTNGGVILPRTEFRAQIVTLRDAA